MAGLDRIVDEIAESARKEAKDLVSEAEDKAEAILAAAREKADALKTLSRARVEKSLLALAESRVSSLARKRRQAVLEAKQAALKNALEEARKALLERPAPEYFSILLKLAESHAETGAGEIVFNERDLSRLPKGFEADLGKALGPGRTLSVSGETAPIDGGFLIKYGENIENCSFASLFRQRRDEFVDLAKEALFG
jgi:V/A-type H+-transporting ATPase subunit E